jgi:hypothetical protein
MTARTGSLTALEAEVQRAGHLGPWRAAVAHINRQTPGRMTFDEYARQRLDGWRWCCHAGHWVRLVNRSKRCKECGAKIGRDRYSSLDSVRRFRRIRWCSHKFKYADGQYSCSECGWLVTPQFVIEALSMRERQRQTARVRERVKRARGDT